MRRSIQLAAKRTMDILLAVAGSLLLLPLLLLVAASIALSSPGPVLFWQERTGLGGRPFRMAKFRTMYVDCCDESGLAQIESGDSRVTPLGRILRQTKVDELPLILNILRGDMSFVGPRPHVPRMLAAGVPYEALVPGYAARHRMRPGLTGLAQVNGLRGLTSDRALAVDRIRRDIEYVETFSITLDFKIIARTIYRETMAPTGT